MTDPTRLSATEIASSVRRGDFSAAEVLRAHVDRIAAHDGRLGAFVRLNPEAEREAADVQRRIGDDLPLAGVPVAIKDNLSTVACPTTCGSRLLEGFTPDFDATAVERLRAAGAVVVGKTNMDEFGMGSSTETSSAGPTRNPWDLERVAGGSSGGSSVAVAARMAALALGSDTGGSVRQPAAFCGACGLKPTWGRVSRSGLVAFGSSLEQVGPLGRSVGDVAAALAAIAGPDPRDATSAGVAAEDFAADLDLGVRGLRVGMPREFFGEGIDPEIRERVHGAADALAASGARIEEVSLGLTRYAVPTYYLIATAEASSNLARYDGLRFGVREEDRDGLTATYRRTRSAGFGSEVQRRIMLGTFALSAGYHGKFYGKAQRARAMLRDELDRLFDEGIDVLLAPTTPSTAFRLEEKIDDPVSMYLSDVFTVTANLAGNPALSIPLGCDRNGLPIGGQLIGERFGETLLLRVAAELERQFPLADPPDPPDEAPGDVR